MKYIDEYRDVDAVRRISQNIFARCTRKWNIMELCGGQTHSIMKYSIEEYLPSQITLIHGPGCPVCVTPIEMIDRAIYLSLQKDVILVSYGDMLRVPGSWYDLLTAKANGGNVAMVYSPMDAVKLAEENPNKKIVFFSVGFETTAPANAFSVLMAKKKSLKNYFLLCSHVLVPPALKLLLSGKDVVIDAILAAGHVCTVTGYEEYIPISEQFKVPIVVTGFEPVDIMLGIDSAIAQLESGKFEVENRYSRVVIKEGNLSARKTIDNVFEVCDRNWRGIGNIPSSGLKLNSEFKNYDAEIAFNLDSSTIHNFFNDSSQKIIDESKCIAGRVLQGMSKPDECPAYGTDCTPERPLGAPMVSAEGACSAYFRYRKK
ncbi:MAG: hydrogenase expression/formation protein HypD [Ignavibacteria bacterium]|nr:hydrogenase expression/formation protein HypD [Ignavibacteria bacterium]